MGFQPHNRSRARHRALIVGLGSLWETNEYEGMNGCFAEIQGIEHEHD
jgi:hypothetical protein